MSEISDHKVRLTYFNSDDGVYIECSCGYSENLGFDATPMQAGDAEFRHIRASGLPCIASILVSPRTPTGEPESIRCALAFAHDGKHQFKVGTLTVEKSW